MANPKTKISNTTRLAVLYEELERVNAKLAEANKMIASLQREVKHNVIPQWLVDAHRSVDDSTKGFGSQSDLLGRIDGMLSELAQLRSDWSGVLAFEPDPLQ